MAFKAAIQRYARWTRGGSKDFYRAKGGERRTDCTGKP